MSKPFRITLNRSKYTSQSLISILDVSELTASPVTDMGVSYIAYCELKDYWLIERNGKSEAKHIDLFFAVDGEFSIESSAGISPVRTGEVAVVPSWIDRRLSFAHGASKHLYVRIDAVEKYQQIDRIEVRGSLYTDELVCHTRHIQQAGDYFPDAAEYRYHLFSVIQLLLRRELCHDENEEPRQLDRLFRTLNSDEAKRNGVAELARRLGVSVSTFYKLCVRHYGKSPGRVIGEINMRKAAELLRGTDLSLENISEHFGYANQFAFSKAFKKAMAMPPLQYRKQPK